MRMKKTEMEGQGRYDKERECRLKQERNNGEKENEQESKEKIGKLRWERERKYCQCDQIWIEVKEIRKNKTKVIMIIMIDSLVAVCLL